MLTTSVVAGITTSMPQYYRESNKNAGSKTPSFVFSFYVCRLQADVAGSSALIECRKLAFVLSFSFFFPMNMQAMADRSYGIRERVEKESSTHEHTRIPFLTFTSYPAMQGQTD